MIMYFLIYECVYRYIFHIFLLFLSICVYIYILPLVFLFMFLYLCWQLGHFSFFLSSISIILLFHTYTHKYKYALKLRYCVCVSLAWIVRWIIYKNRKKLPWSPWAFVQRWLVIRHILPHHWLFHIDHSSYSLVPKLQSLLITKIASNPSTLLLPLLPLLLLFLYFVWVHVRFFFVFFLPYIFHSHYLFWKISRTI